jgi:hypothetical protein
MISPRAMVERLLGGDEDNRIYPASIHRVPDAFEKNRPWNIPSSFARF